MDYSDEITTLFEFYLQTTTTGTLLTVTESGFEKLPQERIAEAFRMDSEGWAQQMENIKAYVDERP